MIIFKTDNILNLVIPCFILLFLLKSCCFCTKNTHLGNHFYISEYDIKDTRVMYCSDGCCNSVIDVVPQTVLEYDYNSKWIIAKADSALYYTYWIIDKESISNKTDNYKNIKEHIRGPLDSVTFSSILSKDKINLRLKKYLQ